MCEKVRECVCVSVRGGALLAIFDKLYVYVCGRELGGIHCIHREREGGTSGNL